MYGNLDPIEHRAERVVIVLVGLIGAGKVRVRHFFPSRPSSCLLRCDNPHSASFVHKETPE